MQTSRATVVLPFTLFGRLFSLFKCTRTRPTRLTFGLVVMLTLIRLPAEEPELLLTGMMLLLRDLQDARGEKSQP